MRLHRQGSDVRVTVSAREVSDFAARWPCSGLAARGASFTFDRAWNLVDTNADEAHPDADGGAILALCDDAEAFAKGRTCELCPAERQRGARLCIRCATHWAVRSTL